jgi:CheY-like chemotaxis protein
MKHLSDVISQPSLITHLTGASNYTWVHFRNGATLLLSKSLSSFEELLPAFVRVHKTALVNPKFVDQIQSPPRTKAPGTVGMQGGIILPVSRRRWNEVVEALQQHTQLESTGLKKVVNPTRRNNDAVPVALPAPEVLNQPNRQIFAVIKDDVKSVLLRQILEEKWPHCTVRFFVNGASLTDHIAHTAHRELPALVLLDVRTVGWAGLSALEYIKTDKRLRLIPTVLFINGHLGNDVEVCYAAGANSVVSQPTDYAEFTQAVERICQYWLAFAALPSTEPVRA